MKHALILRLSAVGIVMAGLAIGLYAAQPAHAQAPSVRGARPAEVSLGVTADVASELPSVRMAMASPQGGTSLQDLLLRYWTWALGGNQADHKGDTQFLPIPSGTSNGDELPIYVGELDHGLKANQSFFLPIYVFYGEHYVNDTEDPPEFPDASVFTDANVLMTLDGDPLIDSDIDDLADFYTDTVYFSRPLAYAEPTDYGSDAAIWVKGLSIAHAPLAPGAHTLHLVITSDFLEPFGLAGWDNTWHLTVD